MFSGVPCIFRLTWHCSTSVNTRISELTYNFICFVCVCLWGVMIFTVGFESYQQYIMLSAVNIACIPQCRVPVMSICRIQGESLLCHFIS